MTPPCVEVGDTLEIVDKVLWRQTVKTSEDEYSEFVLDSLLHFQPMQLLKEWRHTIILIRNENTRRAAAFNMTLYCSIALSCDDQYSTLNF